MKTDSNKTMYRNSVTWFCYHLTIFNHIHSTNLATKGRLFECYWKNKRHNRWACDYTMKLNIYVN